MTAAFGAQALGVYVISLLWHKAEPFIRGVREDNPGIFTFIGGHGATAMPRRLLEECQALDAVVVGEGEITSGEMVDALDRGDPLTGVGPVIRDGRAARCSPVPAPGEDLDSLPLPGGGPSARWRGTSPASSRYHGSGGPDAGQQGLQRNLSLLLQDVWKTYPPEGSRKGRGRDPVLRQTLRRQGNQVLGRAIHLQPPAHLQVLRRDDPARGQCTLVVLVQGRRRGQEDTQSHEGGGLLVHQLRCGEWSPEEPGHPDQARDPGAEQIAVSSPTVWITTHTTYIFGIPGETFQEGLETIRFARSLGSFTVEFFPITPFPGTPMYKGIEKGLFGTMSERLNDQGMLLDRPCFVPFTMTGDQIMELRRWRT